jgi:hypothetical protein
VRKRRRRLQESPQASEDEEEEEGPEDSGEESDCGEGLDSMSEHALDSYALWVCKFAALLLQVLAR